jgi:hypothetical protein
MGVQSLHSAYLMYVILAIVTNNKFNFQLTSALLPTTANKNYKTKSCLVLANQPTDVSVCLGGHAGEFMIIGSLRSYNSEGDIIN